LPPKLCAERVQSALGLPLRPPAVATGQNQKSDPSILITACEWPQWLTFDAADFGQARPPPSPFIIGGVSGLLGIGAHDGEPFASGKKSCTPLIL